MLHLRVIAPEELRDPVIDVLRREVGVANVLLYPGAALEPPGDEITADIARECANDVIKELKALDVQHRGAITLDALDTVLSTRAHRAEDEAEGDPGRRGGLGRTDRRAPARSRPSASPSCCS